MIEPTFVATLFDGLTDAERLGIAAVLVAALLGLLFHIAWSIGRAVSVRQRDFIIPFPDLEGAGNLAERRSRVRSLAVGPEPLVHFVQAVDDRCEGGLSIGVGIFTAREPISLDRA